MQGCDANQWNYNYDIQLGLCGHDSAETCSYFIKTSSIVFVINSCVRLYFSMILILYETRRDFSHGHCMDAQ